MYRDPREPTQAAYHNPYETTNPYYSGIPDIPPPPPKQRRTRFLPLLLLGIVIIVGGILLTVGYANSQNTHASVAAKPTHVPTVIPTVPPTPTPNLNYTASDILHDLNAAGIHPKFVEYNNTIWSWTSDTYYISVHAISSTNFSDDSSCSGYCSPANIGVWVYDNPTTAMEAFNEVVNDEHMPNASIPMMGIPSPTLHGRCLLLSNSDQSIYVQVITQYCI